MLMRRAYNSYLLETDDRWNSLGHGTLEYKYDFIGIMEWLS